MRRLRRESLNQPVLLLVEDLHWSDSETQAWLHLVSDRVAPPPPVGRLPARVPTRLGEQNLLQPTAALRSAAARSRRCMNASTPCTPKKC